MIGPSGSGKSTLLRTLNRLHEPDRGDILLDGQSVLADDPAAVRQRIGMVFQHFNLFPHLSVLANVMLAPRKLKRLSGDAARELALANWTGSGMSTRPSPARRPVRWPTAAGRDRPGIGHATSGDAVRRGDLGAGSRTGQRHPGVDRRLGSDGMTMLVVTHEMAFARSTSDTVVFMDHGRVVETGPPAQIFEAAATERLQRFLSQVL